MNLPGGGGVGPTWLVTISYRGARPSDAHVELVLRQFRMRDAEEDNHTPGITRSFFMPVDPKWRGVCDCKETEETIVEDDGYEWQNPRPEDGRCRGCEYEELFGAPCPIHLPLQREQ